MSGKKSKVPVQLDIGNMLAALEKKQQSQKAKQDSKSVILSGGLWLHLGLCHCGFLISLSFLKIIQKYVLIEDTRLKKLALLGRLKAEPRKNKYLIISLQLVEDYLLSKSNP